MLAAIGVDSVDELFEQIPAPLRLGRPLELPEGMSEAEVFERLAALAARNADAEEQVCFVGAGMYDHYVPAIVDAITQRSEFLTPYTPYQPEISQGGLQVMFEFQTAMSELTGLPVSNAGLYEGPSSVASAGYLAMAATKRSRFVVSRGLHPHSRETLETYAVGYGAEIVEVGLRDGETDAEALAAAVDGETAAVFLQNPNFLGAVERVEALGAAAEGARRAAGRRRRPDDARHPQAAGRVRRRHRPRRGPAARQPARLRRPVLRLLLRHAGADPPHARPHRRRNRRRRWPPRLRPRPADPRAAHPPREGDPQHLHRAGAERAGGDGPPRLARAKRASASWASCWPSAPPTRASGWPRSRGSSCCTRRRSCASSPIRLDAPVDRVLERCAERGIAAGYPLGRDYPEHEDGLLVAITERRTKAQIDDLAEALGAAIQAERGALVGNSATKAPLGEEVA